MGGGRNAEPGEGGHTAEVRGQPAPRDASPQHFTPLLLFTASEWRVEGERRGGRGGVATSGEGNGLAVVEERGEAEEVADGRM